MRYTRESVGEALGTFLLVLGPLVGGVVASVFFARVLEPLIKRPGPTCGCADEEE
jgi:hypothetical protein